MTPFRLKVKKWGNWFIHRWQNKKAALKAAFSRKFQPRNLSCGRKRPLVNRKIAQRLAA